MKYKITFILLFEALYFSYGQTIFLNEITGANPSADNPYINGQFVNPNITVSGIGRGPGIDPIPAAHGENTYAADSFWPDRLHLDDYFEFVLTPNPGYEINFNNFIYTGNPYGFFGTPPDNISIRSSLDNFVSYNDIGIPTLTGSTIDLSGPDYQNITTTITFRVYAWGGVTPGVFGIDRFEFNGTVTSIPCYGGTAYTWESTGWSPVGTPTLNDPVVINENYNTAINESFSTCNLTVNTGKTLTISNDKYVEVENDIIVDGTIIVQPHGSIVQVNDTSFVTNNGTITVNKETAPANNWYEYTYWSSPVKNETIGNALSDSDVRRRFWFNAKNYLDATMETANNNAKEDGQDDIDDDGNDWVYANSGDIMKPGVGYASTHDEDIFNFSLGNKFIYSFDGAFNNGIITVPIYRNDEELYDNNWNLVGNPYPSAIDADSLLAVNSAIATNIPHNAVLDGALFLWSQNTAHSNTNNGNENQNFAVSDYAVINLAGQTAGGDGEMPSRNIPSGQGFFVSMDNTAAATYFSMGDPDVTGDIVTANIVFNNSMRVTDNNNQFFRTSDKNTSEKLWLNLTSDNGVFNQILVAYVKGATDAYDGMAYDTPKNLSSGASAILYSNIENEAKKFVIQGKSINSINEDEIISIGYKTAIDIPTIYTLSIPQIEGDFLTTNAVYLKDNLLNKIHNLKDSDYNFISEVGEFNNRFEIMFSETALLINTQTVDEKALSIVEHINGDVQFKLNATNKINNIKIIDLQGHIVYDFKVNSNDETFKLSKLSHAPYFAKVLLDNNYVITKKAIKKY
ncbi:hypothetical protein MWU50_09300 [Flavobacteriaceae bacterium S0862]|nr:hypothetical protein [Flavobacteriaceae bacterium S0862]